MAIERFRKLVNQALQRVQNLLKEKDLSPFPPRMTPMSASRTVMGHTVKQASQILNMLEEDYIAFEALPCTDLGELSNLTEDLDGKLWMEVKRKGASHSSNFRIGATGFVEEIMILGKKKD